VTTTPLRANGSSGAFRRLDARPLGRKRRRPEGASLGNLLLLLVEIGAVVAVAYLVAGSLRQWRAEAEPVPMPTAFPSTSVAADVLPGGHAVPGAGSVPQHLQSLLDPQPALAIPTAAPGLPSRIVIEALGVDSPIVEGDDSESLKMAVGHHVGSANPGERGNLVLAGHNDVYGQVFRYLDRLVAGDTVVVYSGSEPFEYTVRDVRVVDPQDVSVMNGPRTPTLTLISCYPYLIDTHRIVVVAELTD